MGKVSTDTNGGWERGMRKSWGAQYPGHRVAFNKQLGLGKKAGEDYAAVPSTIKGGGVVAQPGGYTNRTLLQEKKKIGKNSDYI